MILLQQLTPYTELLDNNRAVDLISTGDGKWQLSRDKKPYGAGWCLYYALPH